MVDYLKGCFAVAYVSALSDVYAVKINMWSTDVHLSPTRINAIILRS